MINVFHICSECYPAAKAGGMGDVVGALPIYLPQYGVMASVVVPKYDNKWFKNHDFFTIKKGSFTQGGEEIKYEVQKLKGKNLGFPFYCIDIPGKFDRKNIYLDDDGEGYKDEPARNISFQVAVLEWLSKSAVKLDAIHCHDHMTGLIPFFMKFCPAYKKLANMPSFLTIHNGQYRGIFDWELDYLLPPFDPELRGWLDWDGVMNSLAAAVKCAWSINTVSPSYMKELMANSDTLTHLYGYEGDKCVGILNGIDNVAWNPSTDSYLDIHLNDDEWKKFKKENKKSLIAEYKLSKKKPLVGFIGRMAFQKGADIMAEAINTVLSGALDVNFIILGSGDKNIEKSLLKLAKKYPDNVASIIAYDEALARKIYASTDYLIMPSRFEPCGLNQIYAMRYGSIPIVTHLGGLIDTVPDVSNKGNGIVIKEVNAKSISKAISRANALYKSKTKFNNLRKKITALDFSWSKSAKKYADLYFSHINH